MTAPRYARLASRLLVRATASLPAPAPAAEARAQAVDALTAAIAARAKRRRAIRWAFVSVAAAAVIANAVWISHFSAKRNVSATTETPTPTHAVEILAHSVGGGASVVVDGSHAPLVEGRAIGEGSRVITPPDGRATLAFSTGTTVLVGEGTEVTVSGDGGHQVLHLSAGWIDLHVAKLRAEQQFFVDTSELQVEVRGTQFRVSIARPQPLCADGATTRIAVTEGVVLVHRNGLDTRLVAGENWPGHCEPESVATSAHAPRTTPSQGGVGPSSRISRLGEQNDLFAAAIAARRQGDVRGALAAFERLIKKYPTSPLAENASVESIRLLKTTDPGRAIDAALRYLATYPAGYARSEAEAILAGTP
jgi:FecR protein/Outer membrane lipoprotein